MWLHLEQPKPLRPCSISRHSRRQAARRIRARDTSLHRAFCRRFREVRRAKVVNAEGGVTTRSKPRSETIFLMRLAEKGLNAVRRETRFRKIPQILGHDDIAAPSDRRRQNVPVVRVQQSQRRNQFLVSHDQTIARCPIHHIPRSFQGRSVAVRLMAQQRLYPLAMNRRRPPRSEYIGNSQLQQKIAHRRGIKHIRVEQRRPAAHARA